MPKINRNGRASILTGSDFSKLSKQLNSDRDRLLFNILRYTGERIGAVIQLEWRDCYERPGQSRTIILFKSKTRKSAPGSRGEPREVPVHEELRQSLRLYQLDWQNTRWLFPSPDPEKHITRQAVDKLLRRAVEKAGLGHKGISTHSFRRTLITDLAHKGVDVRTIQAVTGHKDLSSVQRYIEADEQTIRRAIELL